MIKEIKHQNITTWPELGINFWAINKNASSTFITHFSLLTNDIDKNNYDFDLGQDAKLVAKRKKRYIDSNTAYSNGLLNVGISRNPHARFISCYKQFKNPKNIIHEKSRDKARFDPTWSADDFLEHIDKKFTFRGNAGNKHFWKQILFLHTPEKMDYILKLEDIKKIWPFDFEYPNFISNKNESKEIIKYNKLFLENLYKEDFENFDY